MSTWSPKNPTSGEFFTVDLVRQLAPNDSITGGTCTISIISGTDPAAASMLSGTPVISGTNLSQKVIAGVDGVRYRLNFSATTLLGETLPFSGDFYVLAPLS